jgi:ASC-1-like (ASCH) protein
MDSPPRVPVKAPAPLRLPVCSPWLEEIAAKRKTVEGRPGSAARWVAWIGRPAEFYNAALIVKVRVVAIRHYATLPDYVAGEGWRVIAPHLGCDETALGVYRSSFYTDAAVVQRGGMNAIEVVVVSVGVPERDARRGRGDGARRGRGDAGHGRGGDGAGRGRGDAGRGRGGDGAGRGRGGDGAGCGRGGDGASRRRGGDASRGAA